MTNDPRSALWSEAFALLDEADRLHKQFFTPGQMAGAIAWEPPVDMFETDRCVWISVVLPGVPNDRIESRLEGATIVVAGHRRLPDTLRGARVHRLEIPQGRFERRIALPTGRYTVGRNELENGCLIIELIKQL